MKVWIGCLACYNEGKLVGDWYDAIDAGDVTPENIHPGTFATTPIGLNPASHEELWVFDTDEMPVSEEMSPMDAVAIAEFVESLAPHQSIDAVKAYADHEGCVSLVDVDLDRFDEAYAGEWRDTTEFAVELADDVYGVDSRGMNGDTIAMYFDYEKFANDLFMGDYYEADAPRGMVYVFRSL